MCGIARFFASESGAVTVDWVMLTAGVVGLSAGAVAGVAVGQRALGLDIRASLENTFVAGNALYVSSFGTPGSLRHNTWTLGGSGGYDGWMALGRMDRFEIMDDYYRGILSPDGSNMLDMGGSPGNLAIGRTLNGLRTGDTLSISFSAADPIGNNRLEVYFGGQLLGAVQAGTQMSEYQFDFTAGTGDGMNLLELREAGQSDNVGTYIAAISIR